MRTRRSTALPLISCGSPWSPVVGLPRLDREDRRAAGDRARVLALLLADRTFAPELEELLDALDQVAADEDVQPVADLKLGRSTRQQRLLAAHDHADQRLARQLQLARRRGPAIASPSRIGNSKNSAPSLRMLPAWITGGSTARWVVVSFSRLAKPLEGRALEDRRREHDEEDDVVDRVRVGDAVDQRECREHDRHRTTHSGPLQQRDLAELELGRTASRRRPPPVARRTSAAA